MAAVATHKPEPVPSGTQRPTPRRAGFSPPDTNCKAQYLNSCSNLEGIAWQIASSFKTGREPGVPLPAQFGLSANLSRLLDRTKN